MIKPWIFILLFFPFLSLSQSRLTNREVYDFNVGDEFQYKVNYTRFGSEGYRHTVLTKKIRNDSISYSIKYDSYTHGFDYSFSSEIRNLVISDLDSFIDNLYQAEFNKNDTCFTDSFYSSKKFQVPMYYYSYSTCSFEARTTNEEFGAGLGKTLYEHRDPTGPFHFWDEMIYYKKGLVTFGNQDKAYSLGIDNKTNKYNSGIYPNIAHDRLNVIEDIEQLSKIQIVNCYGKNMLLEMLTSSQIDVSNFPPGIYYFIFEKSNRRHITKFLKD